MLERKLVLAFFSVLVLVNSGCSLDAMTSGSSDIKAIVEESKYSCPTNYIYIPARSNETPPGFCVAKYEMKDVGGTATSQAGGTPWGSIDRDDAMAACQALGSDYDLISRSQWMQVADNMTTVSANWSSGAFSSGEINRGHFDSDFGGLLEAGGDDHPCYGLDLDEDGNPDSEASLDAVCSSTTWHANRRTLKLNTGKVIWDFAGNSWEWNKDDFVLPGATSNNYISDLSVLADTYALMFAPATQLLCGNPNSNNFCGMGHGWINSPGGAIARGGSLYNGTQTGLYSVDLDNSPTYTAAHVGFRCVSVATPK